MLMSLNNLFWDCISPGWSINCSYGINFAFLHPEWLDLSRAFPFITLADTVISQTPFPLLLHNCIAGCDYSESFY